MIQDVPGVGLSKSMQVVGKFINMLGGIIRLKRSVNAETGSVSDLHAYLGNENNVNHTFIQTLLLLVTVDQMITLNSEDNKRQFDMFI